MNSTGSESYHTCSTGPAGSEVQHDSCLSNNSNRGSLQDDHHCKQDIHVSSRQSCDATESGDSFDLSAGALDDMSQLSGSSSGQDVDNLVTDIDCLSVSVAKRVDRKKNAPQTDKNNKTPVIKSIGEAHNFDSDSLVTNDESVCVPEGFTQGNRYAIRTATATHSAPSIDSGVLSSHGNSAMHQSNPGLPNTTNNLGLLHSDPHHPDDNFRQFPWDFIPSYPRTSSRRPSQVSRLSARSQASSIASSHHQANCSCGSARIERNLLRDREHECFSLIEMRIIPAVGDENVNLTTECANQPVAPPNSLDHSSASQASVGSTVIFDWKDWQTVTDISALSSVTGSGDDTVTSQGAVSIPGDILQLSNCALRTRLLEAGDTPGPVIDSTRRVYQIRLAKLLQDPTLTSRRAGDPDSGECVLSDRTEI